MVSDMQEAQPADGDEVLVKIIFGVKLAINYRGIRLIHFEDFVRAILLESDNDAIVVHAVLRRWLSAVVNNQNLLGGRLRTDLLFLRCNYITRDRMISVGRNLLQERCPGNNVSFVLHSES